MTTWAFCYVNSVDKRIYSRSGVDICSNNPCLGAAANNYQAELYSILLALEGLPIGWSGPIFNDNEWALKWAPIIARGRGQSVEDKITALMEKSLSEALARLSKVKWRVVKGHPSQYELRKGVSASGRIVSVHQDWCDRECTRKMRTVKQWQEWKPKEKQAWETMTDLIVAQSRPVNYEAN